MRRWSALFLTTGFPRLSGTLISSIIWPGRLVDFKLDYETNQMVIDWSRTKAFPLEPCHAHIFVNLQGRDPDGIVDPMDYEKVQEEIIDAC